MDKEKALNKIKKCLALSKSANEHEAAQALKQAQALMKQYGINEQDIELSAIQETEGLACAQTLPQWQGYLAGVVARSFGVCSYVDYAFNPKKMKVEGRLKFYGMNPRNELAEYAYQVLLRQLKAARADYIKTQLARVRLAKNKTMRADEFCLGWIAVVSKKVDVFANGERETELLELWKENKGLTTSKLKLSKGKSLRDRVNGWEKGQEAALNHAMNSTENQKLEDKS
ncbi:DUF2786 domain-containing protein [Neisseria sp. N95_16]|uniref:DUF2786 domain-containing protein n=1 Tax=Neisseria brasiliensis TaxID=2666100 RepID=A0A5Q3S4H0_9NEIS|nr:MULTISPECIES: DUF2786 domain-containing protein [Neisseria]MRN38962.1 DUF2786 domain-containing protein [Neisseria brasiliensis]MRN39161.1 DUF2786 domain-containing protein [Neisseria brasiliensis]PJO08776.1 DUF2786 domain-containing protein [Neisseria sp. N95_16]PJO78444.1 DUF2786 domain-containing protein [Neisseria sp. N177_16]QGL26063.1 DUF2786 domain-containing protein [Neisseria brasiliensis]